jgi:hypothetical protein
MTDLTRRIETLEKKWTLGAADLPEAVVIFLVSAARKSGGRKPITRFSFSDNEIHRRGGEIYPEFLKRATVEARKHLCDKNGVAVLLADGEIEI